MKDQVYLSNSARGALLDEQAIVNGLKSGKIAGLATDVLEEEPGRKDHPYLAFDNVIMTPHTSAYTMECLEQMGEKMCDGHRTDHSRAITRTSCSRSKRFSCFLS